MEGPGMAGDSHSGVKVIQLWMAPRVRTAPAPSAKPRFRVANWRDYNRALEHILTTRAHSLLRRSSCGIPGG